MVVLYYMFTFKYYNYIYKQTQLHTPISNSKLEFLYGNGNFKLLNLCF